MLISGIQFITDKLALLSFTVAVEGVYRFSWRNLSVVLVSPPHLSRIESRVNASYRGILVYANFIDSIGARYAVLLLSTK